jgi:excisionase family DNA binding protein
MALVVLDLQTETAGHLAVALRRHRATLEDRGAACPPGLLKIEDAAIRAAKSGQEHSPAAIVPVVAHAGLHEREYLSPAEVGAVTGVSLSTVRRWVAGAELRSALIGRRRLIARPDLEAFLESQQQAS